jgi:Rel homology DNA-binding domain
MSQAPTHLPYIEIHEQPKANGLRFRYATEGEKAGSIAGERSTSQHQTYPSVQVAI